MPSFPYRYHVRATARGDDAIVTRADGKPELEVQPPVEFGGPGNVWSPEELLMAAVADCLVLSFRAIARASKLEWRDIDCRAEGRLDRIDRTIKFTEIHTQARLTLAPGGDVERARQLLEKAEATCFVTNSLAAESRFSSEIVLADD